LLIDSFVQPRWVSKIITDIQSSSFAEIVLVVKNEQSGPAGENSSPLTLIRKAIRHRQDLAYILYRKADDLLFKVDVDAFEPVDLTTILADCPTIHIKPKQTKYSDYLREEDFAKICTYRLDVALRFGFRIIRGDFLKIARHGVWSYHHGDNLVNRGGPAGFWEVAEDHSLTGSVLQILSERLDDGRVIYRSYAATDKFSVKRNRNNYYWKSSAFVIRKLRDLHESDCNGLEDDCDQAFPQFYSNRLYTQPNNAEMVRLLWRLGTRYASAKAQAALYRYQWLIGYRIGRSPGPERTLYHFQYMVPPPDRFWADPFPVKRGDTYFIFIEEFFYKRGKGHIALIEMDQQGKWEQPRQVLERDYHLSYPYIFEWRGDYYMIPETAENRTVELYRCTSFPFQWTLEKVLMENVRAADATVTEIDGLWWMFVNIAEDGASKDDELHLFYATTPLGPWCPHRRNPVKSDVRASRSAGRLFRWNGELYRPAQDCSRTYGYAVSLNKIVQLDRDQFQETEVSKILPHWDKRILAVHTLNSVDRLTVIDGLTKRRKVLPR
jgi:hypothetical protein